MRRSETATPPFRRLLDLAYALPDDGKLRLLVNNVGGAQVLAALLTMALLLLLCADSATPTFVLNIGCMPFTTLYNASNAFNHAFSKSLATEMEAQGHSVEVLAFVTGSVDTAGNPKGANAEDAIFSISPQLMSRNALDLVGCGKYIVFPHWKHWLQVKIAKFVPKSVIYKKIMSNWRARKKAE
jgi:hypothetical protein